MRKSFLLDLTCAKRHSETTKQFKTIKQIKIMSKLPQEVVEISKLNFSGHLTPHSWFQKLRKGEKPYFLAIYILSDICYWYRATELRDEATGLVVKYEKKFASDMLQKSYAQYATYLGVSKETVKEAIVYLESIGLIKRVFRTITRENGLKVSNTMYIQVFPAEIAKTLILDEDELYTPPEETPMDSDADIQDYGEFTHSSGGFTPQTSGEFTHSSGGFYPRPMGENYPEMGVKNTQTNTKNTTEITTKNHIPEKSQKAILVQKVACAPFEPIEAKKSQSAKRKKQVHLIDKEEENLSESEKSLINEGKRFSEWFVTKQKTANPTIKHSETDIKNYTKVYVDLRRIDGYDKMTIIRAVEWALNDEFWKTQFLSALKLRRVNKDKKKYIDVFIAKMEAEKSKEQPKKKEAWEYNLY